MKMGQYRWSPTAKLQIIHVFNHAMLVYGVLNGHWWMWVLAFAWWYFLGTLGISIGFHRLLSHNSFQANQWFEVFCTFLGCLATGGSPLGWAGVHRMHHAFPDRIGDPHSPTIIGVTNSYLHNWGRVSIKRKFVKDLLKKPHLRFTHRHYFKIVLGWAMFLYFIHPLMGVFLYSIPAVFAFHAYGFVNAFGHKWGYRTYETKDSSRNSWLVNILTCGEGWHNNHHRFPGHYRIGLKKWEVDISAKILELVGFVTGKPKIPPQAKV